MCGGHMCGGKQFIKHNINRKQIREIIKMHAKWDTFGSFVLHIRVFP